MADEWKDLWQGQSPEGARIVADVLRQRAADAARKRKAERIGQTLRIAALTAIAVAGIFAVDRQPQRVLFGICAVWNLAGLIGAWHGPRYSGAEELTACVSFCRAELQRRRHALQAIWLLQAGPVLLFIGALAYPGIQHLIADNAHITRVAPFLVLLTVWLVLVPLLRSAQIRTVEREIEELKNLEKAAGV